jgi:hypothetical protein
MKVPTKDEEGSARGRFHVTVNRVDVVQRVGNRRDDLRQLPYGLALKHVVPIRQAYL